MLVQVIAPCAHLNGTLHQALMLARALKGLRFETLLASSTEAVHPFAVRVVGEAGIPLTRVGPGGPRAAGLSIVVGLWDARAGEVATRAAEGGGRLILAPSVYWGRDPLPGFGGRAEALWFVSWDQAARSRELWHLAGRVEVVRCAVDTERFRPARRVGRGPQVLCRHSWDVPAKFGRDTAEIIARVGRGRRVVYEMLGAAESFGPTGDERVRALAQDAEDPALFLRRGDLWLYSHARSWRETACIAMLEAMSSGLPVLVNNAGGMREYLAHGRTGFACEDTDEFVEFAGLLLDRPAVRERMGAEARRFVERRHSLASLARRLREVLGVGNTLNSC